ncbi:hypothetical protein POM88_011055 [Heracleum sosnowskyi]|uniref:Uncharacterized protein n=1 Tax=Heracleum sosnowskyi TaxID=360622 RepID=A0AAD8N0F8_9APIA|nr:hypothetical protein POM88_011055 [Heracleum sosnowskyi]
MLEGMKRAFLEDVHDFEFETDNEEAYWEPININTKSLARYLALYRAENWDRIVIIVGPFGRVFELWNNDMGLGPIDEQIMAVHELDLLAGVEVAEKVVEDETLLAQDMV